MKYFIFKSDLNMFFKFLNYIKKNEEELFFTKFQVKNKILALVLHLWLFSTSHSLSIISRLFSPIRIIFEPCFSVQFISSMCPPPCTYCTTYFEI